MILKDLFVLVSAVTICSFNCVLTVNEGELNSTEVDFQTPYTWNEFLRKFGYLEGVTDEDVLHHPTIVEKATKKAQKMYGIKETGTLDQETKENVLGQNRCGYPDFKDINSTGRVFLGSYWKKNWLNWRLANFWKSDNMSESAQLDSIRMAFKRWGDIANVNFIETREERVDILLRFTDRYHGDNNPFDGRGGVLAHGANPPSGEVHFDNDEPFTDGSGVNLMTIACHEIGHALGLAHSDVPGALMAPSFSDCDSSTSLHPDDIEKIQKLYGLPES